MPWEQVHTTAAQKLENNRLRVSTHVATNRFTSEKFPPPPPLIANLPPRLVPPSRTWGGRILTLHINYVAGYTNPLLRISSSSGPTTTPLTTMGFCTVTPTRARFLLRGFLRG